LLPETNLNWASCLPVPISNAAVAGLPGRSRSIGSAVAKILRYATGYKPYAVKALVFMRLFKAPRIILT
jgi:hypothetical protein